jgi:glycosyltransferase involved in cell wall biosynthesis
VFRWGYRKGYDVLLRAYLEEFSSSDDVSLLLVSRPIKLLEGVGEQQIVDDFNNIRASINKSEDDLPHVALYTEPTPERKMPQIYALGNAFVLISRGEGYGLPFCEAASMGLPVIASNCSGHSDFLNKDNSYLVDPDEYVVADRLSQLGKDCYFYEGQEFPEFRKKAINKVKEHMRFVMDNYSEAQLKAKKLRAFVRENYTWNKAVDRVYARLLEICK